MRHSACILLALAGLIFAGAPVALASEMTPLFLKRKSPPRSGPPKQAPGPETIKIDPKAFRKFEAPAEPDTSEKGTDGGPGDSKFIDIKAPPGGKKPHGFSLDDAEPKLFIFRPPERLIPDKIKPKILAIVKDDKPQDPALWPALLHWNVRGGDDVACTATVIGPRTILTAAHCVQDDDTIDLNIGLTKISVNCERHPSYRRHGPLRKIDYALCLLSEVYPRRIFAPGRRRPVEVRYERLSIKRQDLKFRRRALRILLLTGFGCTAREQTGGGPDDMRAGLATISHIGKLRIITGARDAFSAILCAGDSGGGAFRLGGANIHGKRMVVGVNSANIVRRGSIFSNRSYLARTSSKGFRAFLKHWRRKHGDPLICGVSKDEDLGDACHE